MQRAISIDQPPVISLPAWLKQDGRHMQLTWLGSFLVYGILALGWSADIWYYGVIITCCLTFQAIAVRLTTRNYASLKSAMISALGLCLMFKANAWWAIPVCAALTIWGKFLIRVKGKHVFNPTNFGILATILLTGEAWVSPGQWGSGILLIFLIAVSSVFILFRVGRMDTALAFLLTFAGLQFFRNVVYLGWGMDFYFHQLSSGALLLFTFFMITDPVTTPNAPKARIIWASLVGIVAFTLTNWMYIHTAPLWALLFISPFTPLFDKLFIHQKFKWL